jgi:hypothetical protein
MCAISTCYSPNGVALGPLRPNYACRLDHAVCEMRGRCERLRLPAQRILIFGSSDKKAAASLTRR